MQTFTIIAHLVDRIIAQDVSAAAVSAYLSARIDTSRYTILGADGTSVNGSAWTQPAAATSVAA